MLLKPVPSPNEKIWAPTPVIQLLPLAGYFLFLVAAPYAAGTRAFVCVILLIRLLLFAPLILPSIVSEGGGMSFLTPRKARWVDATPYQFILICSALLWGLQSLMVITETGLDLKRIVSSLHDSPAVSALGYDYILGVISIVAWRSGFGDD